MARMVESDILFQDGNFWVMKSAVSGLYTVMVDGPVYAQSNGEGYDDLSLAVARCKYLAKRAKAHHA